jgi:hypothetical protein
VPAAGVSSVFGRTGAVVGQTGDYSAAMVTNAVSTAYTYADPPWITSLSASKLIGVPPAAVIGATQTPWLQDVSAAGHNLTTLNSINMNGTKLGIGTASPLVPLDLPNYSNANSQLRIGSMEFQGYTLNNSFWTDNLYYNGANWIYRNTGFGSVVQHYQGSVEVITAPSGTAGIVAAAATRVFITNAGNIGINTQSPGQKLDVNGNICVEGQNGFYIFDYAPTDLNWRIGMQATANVGIATSIPSNWWQFISVAPGGSCGVVLGANTGNSFLEATQSAVFIRPSVGIGTATPYSSLTVMAPYSQSSLTHQTPAGFTVANTGGMELSMFLQSSPSYQVALQTRHNTNDANSFPLVLNPLTGSVLVGTTSTYNCTFVAAQGRSMFIPNNESYAVGMKAISSGGNVWLGAINTSADPGLVVSNNAGTGILYALGNGNVGIGTISPGYKLDVAGDVNITGTFRVNGVALGTSGSTAQTPWLQHIDAAGYQLGNSGYIGIGTSAPATWLHIKGTYASVRLQSTNVSAGSPEGAWQFVPDGYALYLQKNTSTTQDFSTAWNYAIFLPGGGLTIQALPGQNASYGLQAGDNASWCSIGGTTYSGTNQSGGTQFTSNVARGTAAAPAMPKAGDWMGNYWGSGWTSTGWVNAAGIRGQVESDWAVNSYATCIQFLTASTASAAERMRITSAGYVGIGTAAPLSPLQVITSNDNNPAVASWDGRFFVVGMAGNSGAVGISYDQTNNVGKIACYSPNIAYRTLVINPYGGSVGIGTASPQAGFHVGGGSGATNLFSSTGGICQLLLQSAGSNWFLQNRGNTDTGSGLNRLAIFGPTSNECMTILTNGNVGIGTASPATTFDCNGWIRSQGTPTTPNGGVGVEVGYYTPGPWGEVQAYDRSAGVWKSLRLDGLPLILNSGSGANVGIGNTNPAYKLDVTGIISASVKALLGGAVDDGASTLIVNGYAKMQGHIWFTAGEANSTLVLDPNPTTDKDCGMQIRSTHQSVTQSWLLVSGNGATGASGKNDFSIQEFGPTYANRLAVQAGTGNVGIAQTSPAYKLDISGDCNITGTYRVNGTPLSTVMQTPWASDIDGASHLLNNAGGIGVGIAGNTTYGLMIYKGVNGIMGISISNPTTANGANATVILSTDSSTQSLLTQLSSSYVGSTGLGGELVISAANTGLYLNSSLTPSYVRIGTTNAERMRITAAGKVGIGTTSPAMGGTGFPMTLATQLLCNLQVGSGTGTQGQDGTIQLGGWNFVSGSNWTGVGVFGQNIAAKSTGNVDTYYTPMTHASLGYAAMVCTGGIVAFWGNAQATTAGTAVTPVERMRVSSNGSVCINTTTASDLLVVNGLGGTNAYGQIRMIYGNYGTFFRNDGTNFFLMVTASGDQNGVWTTPYPIQVDLASRNVYFGASAQVAGQLTGSSGATFAGSVAIGTTSFVGSERLAVKGDGTNQTVSFSRPTGNTSWIHWGANGDWYIRTAANAGCVFIQDGQQNVAIGNVAEQKLAISGGSAVMRDGNMWMFRPVANNYDMDIRCFDVSGNNTLWGLQFGWASFAGTAMTITTGGNVGIGVTNPLNMLSVINPTNQTTLAGANQITIGEASNNSAYRLNLGYTNVASSWVAAIQATQNGPASGILLLQPSGGNVGVGTGGAVTPVCQFHVQDIKSVWQAKMTLGSSTGVVAAITATSWGLYFGHNSDGTTWIQSARTDGNTSVYPIVFQGSGGQVGIGIQPGYALDVAGDINCSSYCRVTGAGGFYWNTYGVGFFAQDSTWIRTFNNCSIYAGSGTIATAGSVGVGTSAPACILDVTNLARFGSSGAVGTVPASGVGVEIYYSAGVGYVQSYDRTSGSVQKQLQLIGSPVMILGNVGLGLAPGYLLQLGSDSAAKPGTSTWTVPSDIQLKKNVRPFELGLKEVRAVNPIRYEYNGLGGTPDDLACVGVDAGLVAQVFPESVGRFKHAEGEFLDFNPHTVFWAMLNAVKELASRVENLEKEHIKWQST